jgi:CheY-like chemotaxis protein
LESLGQLAGGVAHDFNNLLAVIANYAAFIEEELATAAAEPDGRRWSPVLDDVRQVRMAADRATSLTHQLLAFGRREVVQPRVLDLGEVVRGVEQILRRTLGEHIELQVSVAPSPVCTVADGGQLEQVLMNLVVNARDAMGGGGVLTIETVELPPDAAEAAEQAGPPPAWACLRVRDTGAGMDPEVLDRAFEPFFTTKPRGGGSGLGLATVYGIVSQAGGHTSIASEPGHGTTVTVLLPGTDEATVGPSGSDGTSRPRGGETILVVEDEDAIREVTRRILTRNGHTVLTAGGGAEAVALAGEHEDPIHLLLTDVVMPQMQGKEVADRVTALRPGIRVLFMSGYAQPVLAEQGTLAEGVRLVPKPFSEHELLASVREVLDGP